VKFIIGDSFDEVSTEEPMNEIQNEKFEDESENEQSSEMENKISSPKTTTGNILANIKAVREPKAKKGHNFLKLT
jgi:hypothetical protein